MLLTWIQKNFYITCHEFEDGVQSLLEDQSLMQPNNLLFHDISNPTFYDNEPSTHIGDINTGSAFQMAHTKYRVVCQLCRMTVQLNVFYYGNKQDLSKSCHTD